MDYSHYELGAFKTSSMLSIQANKFQISRINKIITQKWMIFSQESHFHRPRFGFIKEFGSQKDQIWISIAWNLRLHKIDNVITIYLQRNSERVFSFLGIQVYMQGWFPLECTFNGKFPSVGLKSTTQNVDWYQFVSIWSTSLSVSMKFNLLVISHRHLICRWDSSVPSRNGIHIHFLQELHIMYYYY